MLNCMRTAKNARLAVRTEKEKRYDMDMFEEAKALATTMQMCDMTQEALAGKLGVSQSYIANKLRLLKFEENERRAVLDGGLSERHARAILRLSSPMLRMEAIRRAVNEKLTVSMTEDAVEVLLLSECEEEKEQVRDLCFRRVQGVLADTVRSLAGAGFAVRKSEEEDECAWVFSLCVSK